MINKEDRIKNIFLKFTLFWLIGNLGFFKYGNLIYSFISKIKFPIPSSAAINFPQLLFPVGMSYVIFRLIHYAVDVYRRDILDTSFVNFALYVLFFPTFLAGPVDRFQNFYSQTERNGSFNISEFNYGLFRLICGAVKKVFIADRLGSLIMPVFYSPQHYAKVIIVLCIYGLAIQIYMDFSGYTDMAIGIARLFGYKIMENFDRPYWQKNIALFWRNWHISVYSLIRDYFFFPLFGHKASRIKIYIGVFITMAVFHLWHAASLGFLILGIYHGTGLMIWQLFQQAQKRSALLRNIVSYKWLGSFSWFITFSFVSFGCIFSGRPLFQKWFQFINK